MNAKEKVLQRLEKLKLNYPSSLPPRRSTELSYAPISIAWFIASLIFYIISKWITPFFWKGIEQVYENTSLTTVDALMGMAGILAFIIEPVIWQNNIYAAAVHPEKSLPAKPVLQQAWWRDGFDMLVAMLVALLVSFPFSILMIFKPIFRALILYSSFNYLHLLGDTGNKMWLFNLLVGLDILFYYVGLFFPSWKYNPLRLLGTVLQVNTQSLLRFLPKGLMILHAAIIYSLLLNLSHHTINQLDAAEDWYTLTFYWGLFTVYTRFSFLPDDFDLILTLNTMPWKYLVFNLIIFGLSYWSFLQPFFTA